MHTLNIQTSSGYEASVPFRLPDAITFDCFIPGLGLAQACLHPGSLETDARGTVAADIDALEAWDAKRDPIRLDGRQDAAVIEQAMDVLSHVLDALNSRMDAQEMDLWRGASGKLRAELAQKFPRASLLLIAEMAEAEVSAREAWDALPEFVRRESRQHGRIPRDWSVLSGDMPSAHALAAYVEMLVEQAQSKATKAAQRREQAWLHEQAEEHAASVRSERTDHGIDVWKEGR